MEENNVTFLMKILKMIRIKNRSHLIVHFRGDNAPQTNLNSNLDQAAEERCLNDL